MKQLLQRALPLSLLVSLFLTGCATIASFDQVSYEKATAAKAEALTLMDKATQPYASQREAIEEVSLNIDKAYEYDRGRDLNAETVRLWEILKNPDGNLYGGFLRRWKAKGALTGDAIAIKKPDIAEAFDQIIGLEIGKTQTKAN